MAKKKRKPAKRKKPPHNLPDLRAMEGMMQQFVAGLRDQADQDTPLGKAQALLYRAFEEDDEERRVELPKDASAQKEEKKLLEQHVKEFDITG